jgi:hypothetical protein
LENRQLQNVPAVADVNGDGWVDIVIAVNTEIRWLPNSPDGFAEPWIQIVETDVVEPTNLIAQDLDGDGDLDFIVEQIGNSRLFINQGQGYSTTEFPGNHIELSEVGGRAISIGADGELHVSTFDGIGAFTTSILRQPTPETEGYDFNNDGAVTRIDLDIIHAAIVTGDRDSRFDINADGRVSRVDGIQYAERIIGVPIGDSNTDNVFDSSDFVGLFQRNKYEIDVDATWADGDWNFDGRFDTSDFVLAFQRGQYTEN